MKDFARPVLIINANLGQSFIGIPLTSKIKTGEYSCVIRVKEDKLSTTLISQIRNLDKRRLRKRISRISVGDYKNVIQCLLKLYKIS